MTYRDSLGPRWKQACAELDAALAHLHVCAHK
jgi:hypothetical protein